MKGAGSLTWPKLHRPNEVSIAWGSGRPLDDEDRFGTLVDGRGGQHVVIQTTDLKKLHFD